MSWSLSRLKTFEQCAAKYDYRYNQKLTEEKSDAAERGIGRHSQIEGYLKGTNAELIPELLFYKGFLDHIRTKQFFAEHKVALKRDWSPAEWDSDEMWVRGILDLLVIDSPTEAVVYDWKTGKEYPDHEEQAELYSGFVLAALPAISNVRAIHVYLDSGRNREKSFHRGDISEIRSRWGARAQLMEECVDYIPNPSFMCRYCSFSRWKGGPCRF